MLISCMRSCHISIFGKAPQYYVVFTARSTFTPCLILDI